MYNEYVVTLLLSVVTSQVRCKHLRKEDQYYVMLSISL